MRPQRVSCPEDVPTKADSRAQEQARVKSHARLSQVTRLVSRHLFCIYSRYLLLEFCSFSTNIKCTYRDTRDNRRFLSSLLESYTISREHIQPWSRFVPAPASSLLKRRSRHGRRQHFQGVSQLSKDTTPPKEPSYALSFPIALHHSPPAQRKSGEIGRAHV